MIAEHNGAFKNRRRSSLFVLSALSTLAILYTLHFSVHPDTAIFKSSLNPFDDANKISVADSSLPWPPTIPSNVATLIDGRPIDNLVPLILHFSYVLGPSWPIIIFTLETIPIPTSTPFQRALASNRIQIRHLPPNITFHVREQVSEFLTSPWLYEQLAPAGHILLLQADSILCANSELKVEDFTKYDFVGAPIREGMWAHDEGMNGGLSLRNRTLMLEILNKWSWKEEAAADPHNANVIYEDQWFYRKMKEMNIEAAKTNTLTPENGDTGLESWNRWEVARIPPPSEAMKFSVESIWYDRPLGYHQTSSRFGDRLEEVYKWCPEYKLVNTAKIRNKNEPV